MREPKRIGLSLLDEELLTLINTSAKIFPVTQDEIDNNLNPNGYEYAKVGRAIYVWEDNQWKYVIADDVDIKWEDVKNKPTKYTPSEHTHTIDEIAEGNVYTKDEIDAQLETKAPIDHNHDQFYADINHNHDDKYADKQIEEEVEDINQRLFNIENGYTEGHSHPNVDVLNSITQQQVDNWNTVVNKADKSYVDSALAGKADLTTLNGHTSNTIVHVTQTDKDNWNSKQDALGFTPAKETGVIDTGTSGGTAFTIEETDPSKRAALILKRAGGREAGFFWYGNDYPTYGGKFRIHLDDKSDVLFTNVNDILVDGKKVFHEGNFTPSSGITIGTTKPTDGSLWLELI